MKINPSFPFAIIHVSTLLENKKQNIIYNRLSAFWLYLDCYCNLITREQIEKDLRVQIILLFFVNKIDEEQVFFVYNVTDPWLFCDVLASQKGGKQQIVFSIITDPQKTL